MPHGIYYRIVGPDRDVRSTANITCDRNDLHSARRYLGNVCAEQLLNLLFWVRRHTHNNVHSTNGAFHNAKSGRHSLSAIEGLRLAPGTSRRHWERAVSRKRMDDPHAPQLALVPPIGRTRPSCSK